MTRRQLKVQKRKILGKKVKKLRKDGLIPANIYGKKSKSQALQVSYGEFSSVFRKAKETNIVELLIDSSKTPRFVLIRNHQKDPITDKIIHVDFLEVDLKEKIETQIPIRLEGESPAAAEKKALLLQELNELLIEAQADKLPEVIKVNVEKLTEVGQDIRVKDLKIPSGAEIKIDPERIVVKLEALVSKEAEELEAKDEAAAEEEKEKSSQEQEEKKEEKKEEEKPTADKEKTEKKAKEAQEKSKEKPSGK